MHSEEKKDKKRLDRPQSLNPLESGHAFRVRVADKGYGNGCVCLNPLESGHAFRESNGTEQLCVAYVLIPSNRVMHSEQIDNRGVFGWPIGLNPLESGHAFREDSGRRVIMALPDKVLIPSNRVMHSE